MWEFYFSFSIFLKLFRFRVSAFFAYDKTVTNQRRVEKSAFEDQWDKTSVWILKWTILLRIFFKLSFTPAVTSCYQVLFHWQLSTLPMKLNSTLHRWCWALTDVSHCSLGVKLWRGCWDCEASGMSCDRFIWLFTIDAFDRSSAFYMVYLSILNVHSHISCADCMTTNLWFRAHEGFTFEQINVWKANDCKLTNNSYLW